MKTVYPPTNTVCGGYKNTHIKIGILVSRFSLYFKPPFVAEEIDWTEKNVFFFLIPILLARSLKFRI